MRHQAYSGGSRKFVDIIDVMIGSISVNGRFPFCLIRQIHFESSPPCGQIARPVRTKRCIGELLETKMRGEIGVIVTGIGRSTKTDTLFLLLIHAMTMPMWVPRSYGWRRRLLPASTFL